MDHEQAVRQNATERYLLDEFDPEQRDQFEEHFFDCQDCAKDVSAATMLIDQMKDIGPQAWETDLIPMPPPDHAHLASKASFGWFSPAFATPVFAVLLLLVGYQNLVQLPRLRRPHVLPAIALNLSTLGERQEISVPDGGGFLLNVIIPPGKRLSSYRVALYNPQGKIESIPLPTAATEDSWAIQIPEGSRESGNYSLIVYGTPAGGPETDVGRSSFALQIQK
jgi:hypothetical protein